MIIYTYAYIMQIYNILLLNETFVQELCKFHKHFSWDNIYNMYDIIYNKYLYTICLLVWCNFFIYIYSENFKIQYLPINQRFPNCFAVDQRAPCLHGATYLNRVYCEVKNFKIKTYKVWLYSYFYSFNDNNMYLIYRFGAKRGM